MARSHPLPDQSGASWRASASTPDPDPDPRLDRLAAALVEVESPTPIAFGVQFLAPLGAAPLGDDEPAVDLALRQLPGNDVVRALAGFVAPQEWHAFGVVAPGRAFALDTARAEPVPVRTAYVLDRQGRVAHRLWGLEPGPNRALSAPQGRVPDACRRVLGLPTEGPRQATTLLWILDWLDRALSCALQHDLGAAPPTWAELASLDRGRPESSSPWSILRREVVAGELEIAGIDAEAAQWMDDGLFCREAMTDFAECGDLLRDLRGLLRPATYRRLVKASVARARDDWKPST
jgi:hypothetical protein